MSLKLNVRRMQRTSALLRPPRPHRGQPLEPMPRPMRMPMLPASKPKPKPKPQPQPKPVSSLNPMRARPPPHLGRITAKSAMRRQQRERPQSSEFVCGFLDNFAYTSPGCSTRCLPDGALDANRPFLHRSSMVVAKSCFPRHRCKKRAHDRERSRLTGQPPGGGKKNGGADQRRHCRSTCQREPGYALASAFVAFVALSSYALPLPNGRLRTMLLLQRAHTRHRRRIGAHGVVHLRQIGFERSA